MNPAIEFFKKHLAQTTEHPFGLEIVSAKGAYLIDQNGKKYLDLISGIGVSALGHGHPRIINRIKEQAEKHLHVMVYGELVQQAQNELAEELLRTLPPSLNSFYFVNSGTEANEAALKLVKRATGRSKIIAFKGSYHGSTHGSLSISFGEHRKQAFRPLLPDIHFIELNNYEQLELIDDRTAGVFLETIQGDAGVRFAESEYLKALREKCSEKGALLVLDEIQCGMGRSGKMWAFEEHGIVPDILTMGKALGGGLPIGALAANAELMGTFSKDPILGHITTFGGHPLVCATAAEGLKIIREEELIKGVDEKGELFTKLLQHPEIVEIRQKGLMLAVELRDKEIVERIVLEALKRGLLLFWFLSTPNAFRIAPPLNISKEEIAEACKLITELLGEIEAAE